jgi:hypothetical protein
MGVMSRAIAAAVLASVVSMAAEAQDEKIRIVLVGDSTVAEGDGVGGDRPGGA